jgi:hypothetical protein
MASASRLAGSARVTAERVARTAERRTAAALAVRVARSLYERWRSLGPGDRERLQALAQTVKDRALNLRGATDARAAHAELASANHELADGIIDSARGDPEVDELELRRLREELARELQRLASGEPPARGTGLP